MEDTIVAISSPIGEGAISVIRLTGNNCKNLIKNYFTKDIKKSRYAYYGHFIYKNKKLDDIILIYYKAPNSYTGQDLIEIFCHGSLYIQEKILKILIEGGARLAERGEFTKRAFLNNKLDLSQAEAVMDLISSKNQLMAENSLNILHGSLKEKLLPIKKNLITLLSHIQALIDFPEDEVDEFNKFFYINKLKEDLKLLDNLINLSKIGIKLKEGIKTVITGYVNVGKSSLFNLLLNQDKAIVTNIEGTTRDLLDETIFIDNISLHLYDTAGIRQKGDLVEKIGIERSFNTINSADLIIFMLDASRQINEDEINLLKELINNKKKIIITINKIDKKEIITLPNFTKNLPIVKISVKNALGIENLKNKIKENIFTKEQILSDFKNNLPILTKIRHQEILLKTKENLEKIINDLNINIELDLITIYIQDALNYLGKLTGETVTEDILDEIFSNFCIGK